LRNQGIVPQSIWLHEFAGHTDGSRKEVRVALGTSSLSDDFITPKPEKLIQQVLLIATNEGDLVLDSFLGSGTTAAVAHKMHRCYIGIEMGEHAITHCQPRLRKVVDGEQGGISKAVNWQGGGGFHFYRLGASIFDTDGNINPEIRFPNLAAHIWFYETKTAYKPKESESPLLGVYGGVAYYLLCDGILLRGKPIVGGNVLTRPLLAKLPRFEGRKVIYGETSRISKAALDAMQIQFKQTPYDVKVR